MSEVKETALIKKRFDLVDALRGFAILGILLLHCIEHFNYYVFPEEALQMEWMIALNKSIWDKMFFVFGGKAYGIFALLFGFTFYLQYSKQQTLGKDFGPRFLWRMVLLLGFGWINAILFPGEILLLYAVLSPILFFARRWSDTAVLLLSIFFLIQPWEIYQYFRILMNPEYELFMIPVGPFWQQTMEYVKEASFISMISNSYKGVLMTFIWSFGVGRISQTLGLFALGLYLGRKQLFDLSKRSMTAWAYIMAASVMIFVITYWLNESWVVNLESGSLKSIGVALKAWQNLSQLFFTLSLFSLLFYTQIFKRITKPLLAYGRMSLSNYVMQSFVGGILFYPFAFHLAIKLNVTYSLLLGFVLAFAFIWFCNWWIARYKQGPLEKVWHRLTWLKS